MYSSTSPVPRELGRDDRARLPTRSEASERRREPGRCGRARRAAGSASDEANLSQRSASLRPCRAGGGRGSRARGRHGGPHDGSIGRAREFERAPQRSQRPTGRVHTASLVPGGAARVRQAELRNPSTQPAGGRSHPRSGGSAAALRRCPGRRTQVGPRTTPALLALERDRGGPVARRRTSHCGSYRIGRIFGHAASTPDETTMMTLTTSASATPTDWHRRQRALVAASLIAVPGVKRPTHRRWT
jgi:hypothetical protein